MSTTFDYIIIGAGSAGCVLANRLSADSKNHILLLEAGKEDKSFVFHLPFGMAFSYELKIGNWGFRANAMRNDSRTIYYPRGKVLGGSSSVNAMIYIRGHPSDYDEWANLGNVGWSFKEVLPYFKKAEDQERGASEYHGVGGPLSVSDQRDHNILTSSFIEAAVACGYDRNDDFNGPIQDGFGLYQLTTKNGMRMSAAEGYLKPVRHRANLSIMTQARVLKIIIEKGKAKGVQVDLNGKTMTYYAQKEVLLSAGAIQSPQLLMLSGIGARGQLESMYIKPVLDLPGVGKNLIDHVLVRIYHKARGGYSLGAHWKSAYNMVKAVYNYIRYRGGPLASNFGEGAGFFKSHPDLDKPDIQIHFVPAALTSGEPSLKMLFGDGFAAELNVIHPYSRGEVRLKDANPYSDPIIDLNYFGDARDLETCLTGIKMTREILKNPILSQYSKYEAIPGKEVQSDEELADFIKNTVETIYHPVGTCKMGHDTMAVVDDRLRVHGLKGLRVVDASIMPNIPGGNTNAPTIMIAEKAADMILEDNQ